MKHRPQRGVLQGARRRTHAILEPDHSGGWLASLVRRGLIALILINVLTCAISTVPRIDAQYGGLLQAAEDGSLLVFAAEYAARLWSCAEDAGALGLPVWLMRLRWMASPGGIIDLLAILPFALDWATDIDLRVVVLLRLLRFLKIARYSPGFRSLVEAVKAERAALVACVVIIGSVILTAAGLLYALEREVQPDQFGTIPQALWWAIATVTTVGYGDAVPTTALGRLVGGITMIVGLLLLALPASIVAAAFANAIGRYNFVVTASTVARMPMFAGLEASAIVDMMPAIRTRSYNTGDYIVRVGEAVTSLFLVAEGEVSIERGRFQRRLGPGESFYSDRTYARRLARARAPAKLLVLERRDAFWLFETFPWTRERVTELV